MDTGNVVNIPKRNFIVIEKCCRQSEVVGSTINDLLIKMNHETMLMTHYDKICCYLGIKPFKMLVQMCLYDDVAVKRLMNGRWVDDDTAKTALESVESLRGDGAKFAGTFVGMDMVVCSCLDDEIYMTPQPMGCFSKSISCFSPFNRLWYKNSTHNINEK